MFAVVPAASGTVSADDLGAVVEEVPDADWGEAAVDGNMRDMAWLAPRAAHHQEVCADLLGRVDAVVPLAFGTVFRDESGVRAMLRRQADELRARLAAVSGRAEWVVAMLRDGARARAWADRDDAPVGELRQQIASSPPGRGYLLSRRLDEARRQALLELDGEAVAALYAAVEALAERAYREPLAEGTGVSADGGSGMIARVSLLLQRENEDRLRTMLDELADLWRPRGYDLDVTGPWPAYRFGGAA